MDFWFCYRLPSWIVCILQSWTLVVVKSPLHISWAYHSHACFPIVVLFPIFIVQFKKGRFWIQYPSQIISSKLSSWSILLSFMTMIKLFQSLNKVKLVIQNQRVSSLNNRINSPSFKIQKLSLAVIPIIKFDKYNGSYLREQKDMEYMQIFHNPIRCPHPFHNPNPIKSYTLQDFDL